MLHIVTLKVTKFQLVSIWAQWSKTFWEGHHAPLPQCQIGLKRQTKHLSDYQTQQL